MTASARPVRLICLLANWFRDGKIMARASIAKILDVSRSALYHFIQTRKIAPG